MFSIANKFEKSITFSWKRLNLIVNPWFTLSAIPFYYYGERSSNIVLIFAKSKSETELANTSFWDKYWHRVRLKVQFFSLKFQGLFFLKVRVHLIKYTINITPKWFLILSSMKYRWFHSNSPLLPVEDF